MSTVVSSTLLVLNWEKPFTWPDHDVTRYDITQQTAGETNHTSTTELSHTYSSPTLNECQNVTFMVSAVSDVGPSEPGVLVTGLPIRKQNHSYSHCQIFFIIHAALGVFGAVNAVVRFTKSGDPEVTVTFEVSPSV